MKALVIGGTGTISTYVVKALLEKGWEVWTYNRARNRDREIDGVNTIYGDIKDEEEAGRKLSSLTFDTVCEFASYRKEDVERDYRLFKDKTGQYIFTSSASIYLKPCSDYIIGEGTTTANKYWLYSREKIECENYLWDKFRNEGFPLTVVRPSHTYSKFSIPVALHGNNGSWAVCKRMMEGKRVLVPGDGTTLWTVTHSLDFASGYTGLMGNRHAIGEAFNIMGDEVLTWNEIYTTLADALGVEFKPSYVSSDFIAKAGKKYGYDFEGPLKGDKSNTALFDTSKIKRVVPSFTTNILFHEGVRESVEYYFAHSEMQREDKDFDNFSDRVIEIMAEAERRV